MADFNEGLWSKCNEHRAQMLFNRKAVNSAQKPQARDY